MRCLHLFLASEKLGPKLLMIIHTVKRIFEKKIKIKTSSFFCLESFLFFILTFLFAYTITTYSLISTSSFVMWSNSTHFTSIQDRGNLTSIENLRNIIEWGTWRIFGSTSLTTSDSAALKYLGLISI
jgi:hypothetical protein